MIRILIDMNISPDWVNALRTAEFEAIHWSSIGKLDAPDSEIMAWAKEHQHLVFTHDLDFGALLAASGDDSPSVIQMRCEDTRPNAMAKIVVSAIQSCMRDLERGSLLTIDPKRSRVRVLPVRRESP